MTAKTSVLQLLGAALVLAPALHAQADEATAQRLMVRSGLAAQLRGFNEQIVNDIRQSAGNIDRNTVEWLVGAARQAFRPEVLHQDMTAHVARKLSVSDMNAALAWLETDAGARITRAEELASVSLDAKRLADYAQSLQANPLSFQRRQLISDLIAASGAVYTAASAAETMALGVALGMDSLQPQERRVGEAGIRARLRQAMPAEEVQALFARQLPLSYAYAYRNVSDADLAGYFGFLQGHAGRRYQHAMNAALMEGLARASVQMGELAGARQRQIRL